MSSRDDYFYFLSDSSHRFCWVDYFASTRGDSRWWEWISGRNNLGNAVLMPTCRNTLCCGKDLMLISMMKGSIDLYFEVTFDSVRMHRYSDYIPWYHNQVLNHDWRVERTAVIWQRCNWINLGGADPSTWCRSILLSITKCGTIRSDFW